MNRHLYWRNLHRGHQQSLSETAGPGPVDQNLNLVLAGLCALAALILVTADGYRIGFEAVHSVGRYVPAVLLETLSKFGETLAAICLIALLAKRQPRVLWMGVLASAYATTLTHVLKSLCDTARPPAVLGDWVAVTGPVLKLHSFPSGHTVTVFLLAACFSVGAPRSIRFLFYTLAAAVGASRVWVGVHWPIDVIVGIGVAGLSVGLAVRTMKSANCGLGLAPHLFFVSLIAVCAVWELMKSSEYPLARLFGIAIAVPSLFVLARDYLFRPLMRRQAGICSVSISTDPSRDSALLSSSEPPGTDGATSLVRKGHV